jgi:hypothetical protein
MPMMFVVMKLLTISALVGSGSYKLEPEVLGKVAPPGWGWKSAWGGPVLSNWNRRFSNSTGGYQNPKHPPGTRKQNPKSPSSLLVRFGLVWSCRLPVRRASSRNNSRSCFFSFHFYRHQFDRVPSRLVIFNRVAECCSSWIVLLRLDSKQIGYFPRISALLFFWFLIALVLSCCFFFFFFFFVYRWAFLFVSSSSSSSGRRRRRRRRRRCIRFLWVFSVCIPVFLSLVFS